MKEWQDLISFLGEGAGAKMKTKSGWIDNLNGTNETGFSAIPTGQCDPTGFFDDRTFDATWWTTTKFDTERIWFCTIGYDRKYLIAFDHDEADWGFPVRCIRD